MIKWFVVLAIVGMFAGNAAAHPHIRLQENIEVYECLTIMYSWLMMSEEPWGTDQWDAIPRQWASMLGYTPSTPRYRGGNTNPIPQSEANFYLDELVDYFQTHCTIPDFDDIPLLSGVQRSGQ